MRLVPSDTDREGEILERLAFVEGALRGARERFDALDERLTSAQQTAVRLHAEKDARIETLEQRLGELTEQTNNLTADVGKLRDLLERSVDNTTQCLNLLGRVFERLGVPLPPEATCPDTPATETPPT